MNDSPLVDIPFQNSFSAGGIQKGLNSTNTLKNFGTRMTSARLCLELHSVKVQSERELKASELSDYDRKP